MSNMTTITVGVTSDASIEFTPFGVQAGIGDWRETLLSTVSRLSAKRLTISNRTSGKGNSKRRKCKLLVELPQITSTTLPDASGFVPPPKVGRPLRATVEFDVDEFTTASNMLDLREHISALLANGYVQSYIDTGVQPM